MISVYALKKMSAKDSSSGGAFAAMAEAFFKLYGDKASVYGAAFNDKLEVVHCEARTIEECERFKGSKYVQSKLAGVPGDIEKNLRAGRYVLFTGTPCQVNAVKKYLQRKDVDISGFYGVDLICHGTPGKNMWLDFISWLEDKNKSRLTGFSFRYSKAKWKDYPCMASFADGRKKVNTRDVKAYMSLYFTHLIMREACYNCEYANTERTGDMTIGDFWGIEEVMPEFLKESGLSYSDGVSEVLVNTQKGEKILCKIKEEQDDVLIKRCDSQDFSKYQRNLNEPTQRPRSKEQFNADYAEKGFDYALRKYTGYYSVKTKLKFALKKLLHESGIIGCLKKR